MEIVGNEFGDWEFDWTSGGLTFDSQNLFQGFKVLFKPKPALPGSECGRIAFVQTLKILDRTSNSENVARIYSASAKTDRMTSDDWFLDREVNYSSPWYGLDNFGNPRSNLEIGKRTNSELLNAVLTDMPQAAYSNAIWTFETCVGCIPGSGPAKFFGGLRNIQFEFYGGRRHDLVSNPANPIWVTRVDQTSIVTGLATPEHFDEPSEIWHKSTERWNEQANGSTSMKNHPNQVSLSLDSVGQLAAQSVQADQGDSKSQVSVLAQKGDWASLAKLLVDSANEQNRKLQMGSEPDKATMKIAENLAPFDELEVVMALNEIGSSEALPALREFRQIKSEDLIVRSGEYWASIDCVIKNLESKK